MSILPEVFSHAVDLGPYGHFDCLVGDDETLNSFCPTGKGGGIKPDCSPKDKVGGGDIGVEPKERPDREIHHLGVNRVVQDTKEAWGYHGAVSVLDQNGPEFERGGIKWREGGHCKLDSGEITIHSGTAGESVIAIQHLTAHEMMHGSFEKVYQKYTDELHAIAKREQEIRDRYDAANPGTNLGVRARAIDEMGLTRASGALKPGYEKEYPTYTRLHKFREMTPNEDFARDDGVTPYSEAYWRDYAAGKVTFHIAIHETLAEIAGLHAEDATIRGSKLFKDYYKAVRDEYRVLTGQQKRRKGIGVITNEALFTDHSFYLDSQFNPITDPPKAAYLRWWKRDGTNGWATLSSQKGMTDNRSFFADCPRDEKGHCLPETAAGVRVSEAELLAARRQARAKARNVPAPITAEVKEAHKRMDALGADDYEMQIRGNSNDRAASRQKLLEEFSHDGGHTCPCVYCGVKLNDTTITRDKILTAREGGRYRQANLVPACIACNQARGDLPFNKIKWPKKGGVQ